ncbi:hypothetical protein GIB67_041699 [Kingdonia uniflora]|uniref:Uncharacterized protein n=1 Tax=Kingdonia uniflora TaxID=39325 RepID=A0A7J7MR98_9MAGN|nr:hypothetical protein GIB67_041699 [Kingdonia uniflora]
MVRGQGNGRVVANHAVVGRGAPRLGARVPVPRMPAVARGLRTNVRRGRGLGFGVGRGALPVDEVVAETSVHLGQNYVPEVTHDKIVVPPTPAMIPLGDFQQVFQMFMQQQNVNQGTLKTNTLRLNSVQQDIGDELKEPTFVVYNDEDTDYLLKVDDRQSFDILERNGSLKHYLKLEEFSSVLQRIKSMEGTLYKASQIYTDYPAMATKIRAMTNNAEEQFRAHKNKVTYLVQLASWTTPKGLHCLSMRLTADYFARSPEEQELLNRRK